MRGANELSQYIVSILIDEEEADKRFPPGCLKKMALALKAAKVPQQSWLTARSTRRLFYCHNADSGVIAGEESQKAFNEGPVKTALDEGEDLRS